MIKNKKKLLITGFDPFGGERVNPAWESVRKLPDEIGEHTLIKMEIPTVFFKASQEVIKRAEEIEADTILCVGQAGGRSAVTPEMVAINLMEANIPDNEDNQPKNTPIQENAPTAYFSTLPVREIVASLQKEGIASALSFSAGAFVCNEVLYSLLHHFYDTNVKVGFIHVPFLPEQAKNGQPSMPLDTILQALQTAIKTL